MSALRLAFPRPAKGSRLRRPLAIGAVLVLIAILAGLVPAVHTFSRHQDRIFIDPASVPPAPVAIVFGAGVVPNGSPSLELAHRLDAAVELYRLGKVRRLLMTGDNSRREYIEVAAMKEYVVERGVPPEQVNVDYAGFRTYDSCFRARVIFGVTEAILVTQRYHLPRALYLANAFGIEAVGLKTGLDSYRRQTYYDLREVAALATTWYEVNLLHPLPRYLGKTVDLEHQNE